MSHGVKSRECELRNQCKVLASVTPKSGRSGFLSEEPANVFANVSKDPPPRDIMVAFF